MLSNGLHLYLADIVDKDSMIQSQTLWYVVEKTYEAALEKFLNEANRTWYRYGYHFYEVEDEDEIAEFLENYPDAKARF